MHKERADAFFLCERRRRRRILDVRAADLQEEMTEQRLPASIQQRKWVDV
jgi:hypothetical protein